MRFKALDYKYGEICPVNKLFYDTPGHKILQVEIATSRGKEYRNINQIYLKRIIGEDIDEARDKWC